MGIELFLVFSYVIRILTGNTIYMHVNITTWTENTRKSLINILKIIPTMKNGKTTMGCNITHQWKFKSPMQLFMVFKHPLHVNFKLSHQ